MNNSELSVVKHQVPSTAMIVACDLMHHFSGHRFNLLYGCERVNEPLAPRHDTSAIRMISGLGRVGNEATNTTKNLAGNGLLTRQLVFGVTRSELIDSDEHVMNPYDRIFKIASRRMRHPARRAMEKEEPNKKAHRMPVTPHNCNYNHSLAAGHRWL